MSSSIVGLVTLFVLSQFPELLDLRFRVDPIIRRVFGTIKVCHAQRVCSLCSAGGHQPLCCFITLINKSISASHLKFSVSATRSTLKQIMRCTEKTPLMSTSAHLRMRFAACALQNGTALERHGPVLTFRCTRSGNTVLLLSLKRTATRVSGLLSIRLL